MTQNILQTLLGLGAVILLFLAMAWVMRRVTNGSALSGKHIQLLAGLSLGAKEKLVLVEVGGKQLLLGVTNQSINTLHQFDTQVIDTKAAQKTSDFAKKLQALLGQTLNKANGVPATEESNNPDICQSSRD